ncbi:MAG: proline--tRNA ligase [Defluviitaleaceae bacterium]|nr:proline--tRNA ligase [Defluviitaleaceae bacterium]
MKLDKLVGERFKERPVDCVVDSHALMIRGGYIKQVGNGVYSSYTVLRRISAKVERIIKEEMERIDGQEVQFPVVMPAALWEESGRYASVGAELLRFSDRTGAPMVLGMTHEEAAVHLVREYANSYTKYPFMIYQIQTKFRDEARARAGLIRVREFTMKDGYSFHTSQDDLDDYYSKCHHAYKNIFARMGVPQVVSVESDSGMMGGKVAHEFMLLAPAGEDTIVVCDACEYRANMESAERVHKKPQSAENLDELAKIHTAAAKTIPEVCDFLKIPETSLCKAVIFQKEDNAFVVVFIRGDLEINETKLKNFLKEEIKPAIITLESGLSAGYTGPIDLPNRISETTQILFDRSLEGGENLCCGANEDEHHYTGFSVARDFSQKFGEVAFHDFAKVVDGDICPRCGEPEIDLMRGIEVGNIFQLGTKYTQAMQMQYTDQNGELQYPLMGCYGIGVGRLIASICEASHDDYGPIWPKAIAPWQVHLCCVRADDENVKRLADSLYSQLQERNIEVIYDDRPVRPGVMFSDADLLGVPLRVVCSPRNLKENVCEIIARDKSVQQKTPIGQVLEEIENLLC